MNLLKFILANASFWMITWTVHAFRSAFVGGGGLFSNGHASTLRMKDSSVSYWFEVGDSVEVVQNVMKSGVNLRGRRGVVTEAWEKCDVDPTCCCAEQVDCDLAVRVEFQGDESNESSGGSFLHYFSEEELLKMSEIEKERPITAFDGMSCKSFKLDQLQVESRRRGIASFEPTRSNDTDE